MDFLTKSTSEHLALLGLMLQDQDISKAYEQGAIGIEEMDLAHSEWQAFKDQLNAEWSAERVQTHILAHKRRQCEYYARKMKVLEQQNYEARQKGISYEKRKHYAGQIQTVKKLFAETRQEGIVIKQHGGRPASAFVTPLDMPYVQEIGFDKFLTLQTI